jgi:DNA-binding MarR family transcriptional regulator
MSNPLSPVSPPVKAKDMLIGALLRVPAQAIQRRIVTELNAAGFVELRVPHMAVLQYPGPDGVRPGLLAERAGMSKQAMNQLLRSLEGLDYLVRSDAPDEGRARVVRFTRRGRAAYAKIHDVLRDIEREWSTVLGPKHFAELKGLLLRVWESPLAVEPAGIARATARSPKRLA